MKIKEITSNAIIFDNGNTITDDNYPESYEVNYADFEQIEESAKDYNFSEKLKFELADGDGFRFGDTRSRMFFIPCYSIQDGYYSNNVDIYYNDERVLSAYGEIREC